MPIITLKEIHISFGPEVIFDNLSLRLYPHEKVGLVGPNGSGKTTLLKMILGSLEPDMGQIKKRKSAKTAYLPQEPLFSGNKTVLEELHSSAEGILMLQRQLNTAARDISRHKGSELKAAMRQYDRLTTEFELAGGYDYEKKIKETTAGLGLYQQHYELKTSQLSGGQLSRLGLAKVLLTEANLLLLDEPTNHLDWEATLWLEKYLKNYRGAALIVSHDRFLLDRLVSKIVEINQKKTNVYPGNYSNYKAEKAKRDLELGRQYQERVEFIRRTRDFIARNKDQEGMRKVARGRKTQLEKLLKYDPDFLEQPKHNKELKFEFSAVQYKSRRMDTILNCQNLTKRFDDVTLFENMSFELFTGQKLGIIGPNGMGKTTLLKLALGREKPTSGTVKIKDNLSIGYLDQAGIELNPDNSVIEELASTAKDVSNEKLRGILGAFQFSGDDVFKQVAELSGGERNRLALCKLVQAAPELLVLDEPTNHLDIPAIEALEDALANYEGTVIVVSHDRFLLDKVAERILVLGTDKFGNKSAGKFELVTGSISDYARLVEARLARENQDRKAGGAKKNKRPKIAAGKTMITPPRLRKFNSWSIEKIEEVIEETEQQIKILQERFGEEQICKNPNLLNELRKEFEDKQQYLNLLWQAYENRDK